MRGKFNERTQPRETLHSVSVIRTTRTHLCHQAERFTMWLTNIHTLRMTSVLFCLVCSISRPVSAGRCNVSEVNAQEKLFIVVDEGYTGAVVWRNKSYCPTDSQTCGINSGNCSLTDYDCVLFVDTNKTGGINSGNCSLTDNDCVLFVDTNKTGGNFSQDYGINIQKVNKSYDICLQLSDLKRRDICVSPGNSSMNTSGREGVCPNAVHLNSCEGEFVYSTSRCKNREEKDRIISINTEEGNNIKCVTCRNPILTPKISIKSNYSISHPANGEVDASSAAKAMKNLSSILKKLGKETSAYVTFGSNKGILRKQAKAAELKEVVFGLTSDLDIHEIEDVASLEHSPHGLVSVSKEAFAKANLSTNDDPFAAVFAFQNLTKDANNSRLLYSKAIAVEMGAAITNLTEPISIKFAKVVEDDAMMSCVSWDGEGDRPIWTTDGCNTTERTDSITCQCTHLTFFAVLMASPGVNISSSDLTSLTNITYIGCGLSMFFLGVGLFMHFLLRRTKSNYTTIILMNLFLAMFLLNLFFLSNEAVAELGNLIGCMMLAAALHYSMLSTFTWFAVQAFHLCYQLVTTHRITIKLYILKVCIAGWVLPCVAMCVLIALGKYGFQTINTEKESVKMCWITDVMVHYILNIGFYAVVFLFTTGVFVVVATRLNYAKRANESKKGGGWGAVFAILSLCCLLGITWGFAFFSYGAFRIPSYYIFTILNSFHGFFMFLYYYNTSKTAGEKLDSSVSTQSSSAVKTTAEMVNPYSN
ncbi:hypothetical protein GJAV_G00108460 [Gymnothorax javanicus]|nr:hypothetical protein GJAV_G00108460 [Gymnothorax javanicus]